MNFQVPQFIEIEDKVIGPLTFKQFIYLAGGAGLGFLFYTWLGLYIGSIPIILIAGFSLALAFYRINDRPFIYTVEAFIRFFLSNKLYIWKKRVIQKQKEEMMKPDSSVKKYSSSLPKNKLHELSWSLNVKDTNKETETNT